MDIQNKIDLPDPPFFTTLLVKNGTLVLKDEHIQKFSQGVLDQLGFAFNLNEDELDRFLKMHTLSHLYYRLNIRLANHNPFKISPYINKRCSFKHLKIYPTPYYEAYPRLKRESIDRRVLFKKANEQKVDDWIFVDQTYQILETCFSNIFWIDQKTLFTPSPQLPLYAGVTLSCILELVHRWGYQIKYVHKSNWRELLTSSVYICNSLQGICPVQSINTEPCVIDLELNQKLIEAYLKLEDKKSSLAPNFSNSLEK